MTFNLYQKAMQRHCGRLKKLRKKYKKKSWKKSEEIKKKSLGEKNYDNILKTAIALKNIF